MIRAIEFDLCELRLYHGAASIFWIKNYYSVEAAFVVRFFTTATGI